MIDEIAVLKNLKSDVRCLDGDILLTLGIEDVNADRVGGIVVH